MFRNKVNSAYTSKRYTGLTARNYDNERKQKALWVDEIRTLTDYLRLSYISFGGGTVLDVPLGTGRFLPLYKEYNAQVVGFDISEDMLTLARIKDKEIDARIGNILGIDLLDESVDISVCIRLLNLIDEPEMITAMKELNRVTRHEIIISMRLGTEFKQVSEKSVNHSEAVFMSLLGDLGLKILKNDILQPNNYGLMMLGR